MNATITTWQWPAGKWAVSLDGEILRTRVTRDIRFFETEAKAIKAGRNCAVQSTK